MRSGDLYLSGNEDGVSVDGIMLAMDVITEALQGL
jgi:hypothetical protein